MSLKDSYTAGVRRAAVPLAGRLVSGGRVTPNALTLGGLVLNVATVPLILSGHFIWAAAVANRETRRLYPAAGAP